MTPVLLLDESVCRDRFNGCRSHIFFDGYLPISKRQIRNKRLQNSLKVLAKYQDSTRIERPSECKRTWQDDPSSPSVVFQPGSPTTASIFRGLPPAPFLVPAILDALAWSSYGGVTHIVAGEAESFCALASRECRDISIILSDDSDFFLHDLGEHGEYAYFSTLDLRPSISHNGEVPDIEICEALRIDTFQPRQISERLGISLEELGYQFSQNPSLTLPQAINVAKARNNRQQAEFEVFLDQYKQPTIPAKLLPTLNSSTDPDRSPHFLDPRLSELIQQLSNPDDRPIQLYLLPLLEHPSRASAWSVSTDQRTFAYSICTLPHLDAATDISILECNRKGGNYIMQPLPMMSKYQLKRQVRELRSRISKYHQIFHDAVGDSTFQWRIFAIAEVYNWHLNAGKSSPSVEMVECALSGRFQSPKSWSDIHFEAQIQAVLYALRMIKQALGYMLDIPMGIGAVNGFSELAGTLRDLPLFAELMPSSYELARQVSRVDVQGVLGKLAEALNEEAGYPSENEILA